MRKLNLEIEIEKTSKRIETRQAEIEEDLQHLITQINKYTTWAWRFVWFGAAVGFLSAIFYLCTNTETGFGLNLLGDFMAGTVASIWSLAGLFFIYVAFLGQKQQLLNQQLEIMYSQLEVKYTRLELFGQKEEMKEQNAILKQQKFENTFFQLITLFNSIVNSLDLRKLRSKTDVISTGRDCFKIFNDRLIYHLKDGNMHKVGYEIHKATLDEIISAYEKLYNNDKSDLSHYFRTIYHVIKFVDKSNLENKKQYIAMQDDRQQQNTDFS